MNFRRLTVAVSLLVLSILPIYVSNAARAHALTRLEELQLERSKDIHFQKGNLNPRNSQSSTDSGFVLADLLCKHNLIGMSRKEIENVVGVANSNRLNEYLRLEKNSDLYCFGRMYLELHYGDDERVARLRTIKIISACRGVPYRKNSAWTSSQIIE